jgi:hypothetical protein
MILKEDLERAQGFTWFHVHANCARADIGPCRVAYSQSTHYRNVLECTITFKGTAVVRFGACSVSEAKRLLTEQAISLAEELKTFVAECGRVNAARSLAEGS